MYRWVLTRLCAASFLPILAVDLFAAGSLSLDGYLSQVKEKHGGFKASEMAQKNAQELNQDTQLPLTPQVFLNATRSVDKKEPGNAAFQGTKTSADSYNVGVSKQTTFGLNAKAYYNITSSKVDGANPDFTPGGKQFETKPVVELSQSLWRNSFGSETRTILELSKVQAALSESSEEFKIRLILSEAEMSYWRLAVAREVVVAQEDNLKRAKRSFDWNRDRVQLSLADKADALQAEASLRFRELEASNARTEERAASIALNKMRGVDDDRVSETLQSISSVNLESLVLPQKHGERPDVKVSDLSAKTTEIQAKLAKEKYSPTLELFGSYAMNGRDDKFGDANDESFEGHHPTTAIGLRFSATLNPAATHRYVGATNVLAMSARMGADQKRFDVDREWEDLVQRFKDTKEKLKLAQAIEDVQKEKLSWERQRQQRGRSTTFQVLQFEGDFATSQLNRIQAEAELLRLYAQLKTFGAS